jgi:hypothetical protein
VSDHPSMIELTFADGPLLEGETELARIEIDVRMFSGGREYRIVRTARHGWHYAVTQPGSPSHVCEFVPFRIRRGARLPSKAAYSIGIGSDAISPGAR